VIGDAIFVYFPSSNGVTMKLETRPSQQRLEPLFRAAEFPSGPLRQPRQFKFGDPF
jgi:hypothetical protein